MHLCIAGLQGKGAGGIGRRTEFALDANPRIEGLGHLHDDRVSLSENDAGKLLEGRGPGPCSGFLVKWYLMGIHFERYLVSGSNGPVVAMKEIVAVPDGGKVFCTKIGESSGDVYFVLVRYANILGNFVSHVAESGFLFEMDG